MAVLLAEHRLLVVIAASLCMAFLWLDVALYFRVQSLPQPVDEHIYSPFKGLSVKMIMMDPINNYIFSPLGELFNDVAKFARTFTFISANMVSYAGVVVSFAAAKLVSNDSFLVRRIAGTFRGKPISHHR